MNRDEQTLALADRLAQLNIELTMFQTSSNLDTHALNGGVVVGMIETEYTMHLRVRDPGELHRLIIDWPLADIGYSEPSERTQLTEDVEHPLIALMLSRPNFKQTYSLTLTGNTFKVQS